MPFTGGDDVVHIDNHDPHTKHADHGEHHHEIVAAGSGTNELWDDDIMDNTGSADTAIETGPGMDNNTNPGIDFKEHDTAEADDGTIGVYKHDAHKEDAGDISNVPAYMAFNLARRIDNSSSGEMAADDPDAAVASLDDANYSGSNFTDVTGVV